MPLRNDSYDERKLQRDLRRRSTDYGITSYLPPSDETHIPRWRKLTSVWCVLFRHNTGQEQKRILDLAYHSALLCNIDDAKMLITLKWGGSLAFSVPSRCRPDGRGLTSHLCNNKLQHMMRNLHCILHVSLS